VHAYSTQADAEGKEELWLEHKECLCGGLLQTRHVLSMGSDLGASASDRRDNSATKQLRERVPYNKIPYSSRYFFAWPPLPRIPFCLALLFPLPSSTSSYTAPTDDDIPYLSADRSHRKYLLGASNCQHFHGNFDFQHGQRARDSLI
jgi:hypothetical protein